MPEPQGHTPAALSRWKWHVLVLTGFPLWTALVGTELPARASHYRRTVAGIAAGQLRTERGQDSTGPWWAAGQVEIDRAHGTGKVIRRAAGGARRANG